VVVAAVAAFADDPPQAAAVTTSSNPAAANPRADDRERKRFDIACFLSVGMTHPNLVEPAERAFNTG
jgi:hypothetical protein